MKWSAYIGRFAGMALLAGAAAGGEAALLPMGDPAGYLARLLVNECPFPGERGYVSEADTRAAMRAVLQVVDARIRDIPAGYRREEVAATRSTNLVDVVTAGGRKGQMDGFYKDAEGRPAVAARVTARVERLARIARKGEPGRFLRLLQFAQDSAADYVRAGIVPQPDLHAGIRHIPPKRVTGRAYAWMTDQEYYHPGGDFVRIPDRMKGALGGNRFYTLAYRNGLAAGSGGGPAADRPVVKRSAVGK